MLYCKKCRLLCTDSECQNCGNKKLSEPNANDSVFLISKEMIWSGGIEDILKENGIPCLKQGIQGAGISTKLGYLSEVYQFFVPFGAYEKSKELLSDIFPD